MSEHPAPWVESWGAPLVPRLASGLIPIGDVAERCGKPVEWALARYRDLPGVVQEPGGLFVEESALRAWLRAAQEPREER